MIIIVLMDLIIHYIPLALVILLFAYFWTSKFPYRSLSSLVIVSYGILLTTLSVLLAICFHIHFDAPIMVHIHKLDTETILDLNILKIDAIGSILLLWCFFVILSGFLFSQLAFYMLQKKFKKIHLHFETQNLKENISPELKQNIYSFNVDLLILQDRTPYSFCVSNFSLFKQKKSIILSSELCQLLTPQEIEAVIFHELGHIKNRDTLFFPIFNALSKIMFFDVILKKYKEKLHEEIEFKADLFALRRNVRPIILVYALIKVYKQFLDSDFLNQVNEIGILNFSSSFLKRRIKRILEFENK